MTQETSNRHLSQLLSIPPKSNWSLSSKIDWQLVGIVISVLIVSIIRYRLLDFPLERDEGEYGYIGKLLLEGVPPFKEAYSMKLPGVPAMYALFMMIFGATARGIHAGLLSINAVTMFLLYFSLRRIFNPNIGFIAGSIYGIMAVSQNFLGFAGHATHFVTFYTAIALLCLAYFYENKTLVSAALSGLMFGMSFLMKQQAVYFILFGGLVLITFELLNKPVNLKKALQIIIVYSLSVVAIYLLMLCLILASGGFEKFWFWTFRYPAEYVSGISWERGKANFIFNFFPIFKEFGIVFFLAMISPFFLVKKELNKKQIFFALSFAALSFLSVTPGYYFRQHYFISFLPAVGLLAAISLDSISNFLCSRIRVTGLPFILSASILVLAMGIIISNNTFYYLKGTPLVLSKMIYSGNPFVESIEVSKFIKTVTSKEDKVAILGSEPQILLYSDRRSATGYLYTYGLMENHRYNKIMQQEMIDEIEKEKPKIIVLVNSPLSWLPHPEAPKDIYNWFNSYVPINYKMVGLVDFIDKEQSKYIWSDDVNNYTIQSRSYILIFKRNFL